MVAAYVNNCSLQGIDPVLEYVMTLSDPTSQTCDLSSRKQPLVRTCSSCDSLKTLSYGQNGKDVQCIFDSLATNQTITEVDLNGNYIGAESVHAMVASLRGA